MRIQLFKNLVPKPQPGSDAKALRDWAVQLEDDLLRAFIDVPDQSSTVDLNQTFVTINAEPTLPNSRRLAAGTNVTLTDGGALSTETIAATGGGSVPISKTYRTIIAAGTTNAASATTTGTVLDLTTHYGGLMTAKITNGATGPTIAAGVKVYTSGDNTNFKLAQTLTGDSINASVNEFAMDISEAVMYLRGDITGNTGQNVTCEIFFQEITTK